MAAKDFEGSRWGWDLSSILDDEPVSALPEDEAFEAPVAPTATTSASSKKKWYVALAAAGVALLGIAIGLGAGLGAQNKNIGDRGVSASLQVGMDLTQGGASKAGKAGGTSVEALNDNNGSKSSKSGAVITSKCSKAGKSTKSSKCGSESSPTPPLAGPPTAPDADPAGPDDLCREGYVVCDNGVALFRYDPGTGSSVAGQGESCETACAATGTPLCCDTAGGCDGLPDFDGFSGKVCQDFSCSGARACLNANVGGSVVNACKEFGACAGADVGGSVIDACEGDVACTTANVGGSVEGSCQGQQACAGVGSVSPITQMTTCCNGFQACINARDDSVLPPECSAP